MKLIRYILLLMLLMLMGACATQKNTSQTRWWKAFKTRYNTYFNGHQAYLDGMRIKVEGNKDNYTDFLPLLMVGNKASQSLGSGNFETTVTKCEKAIKLYSIKNKPEIKRGKRMTPEEKAFRNRKEFNPFLKNAWLLMGKAQLEKGEFIEAASTFAYTERLYRDQPQVANVARALLALCYTELEWYYDAEELLRKVRRDSIPRASRKVYNTAMTNLLLKQKNWQEALPYLKQEVENLPHGIPKARGSFLLGQIYQHLDMNQEAYDAFQKCLRQSPPYETRFNAQIMQTEVMPQGTGQKKLTKLKRMARQPNNKDYLDQIYYAIGNVYMATPDTAKAIEAYETGRQKATRKGPAKGILLMSLGDIYWARERFNLAQKCYNEAISLIDKEHERYDEIAARNKVLTQLVPPTNEIFEQDSLQNMVRMPEQERNAIIDKVIAYVKQKQKEEKRAKTDSLLRAQKRNGLAGNAQNLGPNIANAGATWYFYNPQTISQGEQQFRKLWGNRENEDDWRRANKSIVAPEEDESVDYSKQDSIDAQKAQEKETQKGKKKGRKRNGANEEETDSLASDNPLSRAYYLAQLPFTEEQLTASNQKLSEVLFKAGVIEKDQLDNYPLANKTLSRLYNSFPDFEPMDELLYQLFLLELHWGSRETANIYRNQLAEKYPDSKFTATITAPDFEEQAKYGKHIEDSLYSKTYEAYRKGDYETIARNCAISLDKYPYGENRAKFMFLDAMNQLRKNNIVGFAAELRQIVTEHSSDRISELASGIVKNLEMGKVPAEGQFDLASLWEARGQINTEADSIMKSDTLEADRFTDYLIILSYAKDSVAEGPLLYEVSRFNFTNFDLRNFDIEILATAGRNQMIIGGFNNFDEVHRYQQQLFTDSACRKQLEHVTPILISKHNLQLIGLKYTMEEYLEFYQQHFVPSKVKEDLKIDQPTENFIWDEFQDVTDKEEEDEEGSEEELIDEDGGEWY